MNTILESATIEASSKSDEDMKSLLEAYSNDVKNSDLESLKEQFIIETINELISE